MTTKITGLISKSSLEYVQYAFTTLNNEGTFVNLQTQAEGSTKKGLVIGEVVNPGSSHGWYDGTPYLPTDSTAIAQISYTSGTEGEPKGVMICHAALANTTQRLLDIMEVDNTIREYIGVPVNYSFGFGRCRAVSAAGGRFFLPEHGFNPLEISQMLEAGEINAISAVPSLWRLVLEMPEIFDATAHKVRWIEIGSQYMSADEKLQLRELFTNARIIQHYGLTEASRSTFLDIQKADVNHLESVGKSYFGVETAIGEDGRIQIRGPHLASSLLIDGEILPLTNAEGWLTTNDAGHMVEDFLYFDGRRDDIINLGGTKLSPESLETELIQRLGIENGLLALFKTDHATLGDQINIAILKNAEIDEAYLRSNLQQILSKYGLRVNGNFPVHKLDQFPLTNTGKLKRSELSSHFANSEAGQLSTSNQQTTESAGLSSSTSELIEIWEDVLKISPISPKDNFFDIGGDSLSAIRVTLRMEKAGIPKTVCRKIFEGFSIENLVAELTPRVEEEKPRPSPSPENNQIEHLIAIWKDVLKIDDISEHDSFFDLGGDSLSAIRVVVKMEAAGIPNDMCRKIFEGFSIRNIVYQAQSGIAAVTPSSESKAPVSVVGSNSMPKAAKPQKRTQVSSANLALNVVRGLLVLMNIAAHWIPGVVARLPSFVAEINRYFSPIYSSGTPGFALIFGAGLSFFILPRFKKSKTSVNKLCKRNALMLGAGMTCMAIVVVAVQYLDGSSIEPTDVSNAFYSVLFYYFFAVISIPVWLRLLTWRGSYTLSCLTLATIFYACHLIIDALYIPPSENPLIQTGILILTPKYNYLEMSAAVMLGAAAGNWIKGFVESGKNIFPLFCSGVLLVALSIIISFETGEYGQWLVWPKGMYLWTWPFYLGLILIGFYFLFLYIEEHDIDTHPTIGFILRVVSIVGVMAFPLFIGHELVRPLTELLAALSVPGSLAITMVLFFGYAFYMLKKLYGLYYAR